MVNWAAHTVWGTLALAALGVPPLAAAPYVFAGTALTDVAAHRGLRRAWWHDPWCLAVHLALAYWWGMGPVAALAAAAAHLALDLVPYKLSWPLFLLGVMVTYLYIGHMWVHAA